MARLLQEPFCSGYSILTFNAARASHASRDRLQRQLFRLNAANEFRRYATSYGMSVKDLGKVGVFADGYGAFTVIGVNIRDTDYPVLIQAQATGRIYGMPVGAVILGLHLAKLETTDERNRNSSVVGVDHSVKTNSSTTVRPLNRWTRADSLARMRVLFHDQVSSEVVAAATRRS